MAFTPDTPVTCILSVTCRDGDLHVFTTSTNDELLSKLTTTYPPIVTDATMNYIVHNLQTVCSKPADSAEQIVNEQSNNLPKEPLSDESEHSHELHTIDSYNDNGAQVERMSDVNNEEPFANECSETIPADNEVDDDDVTLKDINDATPTKWHHRGSYQGQTSDNGNGDVTRSHCEKCGETYNSNELVESPKCQMSCHKINPENFVELSQDSCESTSNLPKHNSSDSMNSQSQPSEPTLTEFKCMMCAETFSSNRVYKRHKNRCKKVACKYCVRVFDSRRDLSIHLTSDHITGMVETCKHCGITTSDITQLDEHFEHCPNIVTVGEYTCSICGKSLPSKVSSEWHMIQHGIGKVFVCILCHCVFTKLTNLKRHFRIHAQEPLNKVLKDVGGPVQYAFKSKVIELTEEETGQLVGEGDSNVMVVDVTVMDDGDITDHIDGISQKGMMDDGDITDHIDGISQKGKTLSSAGSSVESQTQIKETPTIVESVTVTVETNSSEKHAALDNPETLACLICNVEVTSISALRIHVTSHANKQQFPCDECRRSFSREEELKVHLLEHAGSKPYPCSLCSKPFGTRGALKAHLITHTTVKPFACKYCTRTFPTLLQLECHIPKHTGLRPHVCNECGKSFGHKSALNVHKVAHRDVMRFQCTTCGNMFARSTQLSRHVKVHTGQRDIACTICGKTFVANDNLKKHMRTHDKSRPRNHECVPCGRAFYTRGNLLTHEKICPLVGRNEWVCPLEGPPPSWSNR